MKLRYKNTQTECYSSSWNMYSMAEVLTGDDSVDIGSLDAWIEAKGMWLDMRTAFAARDIISDNYNQWFAEPKNPEDRIRGYYD